jgi:hypothetical protein
MQSEGESPPVHCSDPSKVKENRRLFIAVIHPKWTKGGRGRLVISIISNDNLRWPRCCHCSLVVIHQYSEANVLHFSFSLLTIKGLYMFPALLAHPQETLHKRHSVYCVRVSAMARFQFLPQPTDITRNIPNGVCEAPPEDEQVMLETCRGPWCVKLIEKWITLASLYRYIVMDGQQNIKFRSDWSEVIKMNFVKPSSTTSTIEHSPW